MKVQLSHCLLFLLFLAITHVLVVGSASRTRMSINDSSDDNCTRENGVLICPCNITINGTYYPCWLPITNATAPNNTVCTACASGTYSNNNTGNCSHICNDGYCSDPYKCELCAVGHYSNTTGAVVCDLCDVGWVAKLPGAPFCTACTPGYTSDDKRSSCVGCGAGTFASGYGGVCEQCGEGLYSKQFASECTQCPKGTYNGMRGQSFDGCKGCGKGYYSGIPGLTAQSQCLRCPAGMYCPDSVTVDPIKCPRNYYCQQGAPGPEKCPLFYITEPGNESCSPGIGFYLAIFGSIGLAAIAFLVVWRWRVVKQDRLRRAYRQTEIDSLIPKPLDGPVYKGF